MAPMVKSRYGFSPDWPLFAEKTSAKQVALLQSWGSTAGFSGYQNAEFVQAIRAAGLQIHAEFGCFMDKP